MPAIDTRVIAATLLPGFTGTTLPAWLRTRLRDGLGGACLFAQNIASPEQLGTLTAQIRDANPNAVIAIDEEGGDVTRIFADQGSPYPGNAVLGRIDDLAATEAVGRAVGSALSTAGCTLALAPDVDVNSNPDNPVIGVRSFGSDPAEVAAHSAAWTRGLQSTGVAACAKHFPGHGDTGEDSHLALPVVDRTLDELRERELEPFRAVIAAGARTIMTSHILLPRVDPENPATFSRRVLIDLLRGELGFDGAIVTDALDMAGASAITGIPVAAARALAAGSDLLCIGTENTDEQLERIQEEIRSAVEEGRLPAERVADAARRVAALAEGARAGDASAASEAREASDLLGPERIAASFEVRPAARAWLERGGADAAACVGTVLAPVETEANIAVGTSPWGPLAYLGADPDAAVARAVGEWRVVEVRSGDHTAIDTLGAGTRVIVVGKDNHRHESARTAIDGLRSRGADVLAVDMGWPSDDRRYADLATFGASRAVGGALLALLTGACA